MKRLDGKRAIVTGANRGIGRAIAERLAAEGATVMLCARDQALLDQTVDGIVSAGGKAEALSLDLRLVDAGSKLVEHTVARWGGVDIVVNNAGATKRGEFVELTEEDWADGFAFLNSNGVSKKFSEINSLDPNENRMVRRYTHNLLRYGGDENNLPSLVG